MAKKMKSPAPKARREQNRRIEAAKRNLAHSTPLFNPRVAWTGRKKVGGVPACVLELKQHQIVHFFWW